MTEIRDLIRVFLASPGDLGTERSTAKKAVDSINVEIANRLGYEIILMGWEDTLPGRGRPQEIINRELKLCELFIGIMWMRWGSPPDKEGKYTSGFEEEFELAKKLGEKEGTPEIAMYFKKIDKERLIDPGDSLKKVLTFKKELIDEKDILYKEFEDEQVFYDDIRRKITDYMFGIIDIKKVEKEDKQQTKSNASQSKSSSQNKKTTLALGQGHNFIKDLLKKVESTGLESVNSLEVARFRLLSNSIHKYSNSEPNIGSHDANIIYINGGNETFSQKERFALLECGLRNFNDENIPLWHWYSVLGENASTILVNLTLNTDDKNLCIGSLKAMTLIGTILPNRGNINRTFYINIWMDSDTDSDIKVAALKYLEMHGVYEDLSYIYDEYEKGNHQTSRAAIEAIAEIKFRHDEADAATYIIKTPFESINEDLIIKIFSDDVDLDATTLRLGLEHRSKAVQRECLNKLVEHKKYTTQDAELLINSNDLSIRKLSLEAMQSMELLTSDEEAKKVFIKSSIDRMDILIGNTDSLGENAYNEYIYSKYLKMGEKDLLKRTEEYPVMDADPYFALCERYFTKHSEDLRKNVDDMFDSYFNNYIDFITNEYDDSLRTQELISRTINLKESLTKGLIRKGLDVLCRKGNKKDLHRVRNNLISGFTQSSTVELEYLKKHGTWKDIEHIVKLGSGFFGGYSLLAPTTDKDWNKMLAGTLYTIGKGKLEKLLRIDIPYNVHRELIQIISPSKFADLSDDTVCEMLNNKFEDLRKLYAIKYIVSNNKAKLKNILGAYIASENTKYYNVIYWLDFGASLPMAVSKKAISCL